MPETAGEIRVAQAPQVSPQTPHPPTSRTAYLPQLDGLRAVAILMVFVHHAFTVPLLWAGVDLFFILSGYLITNILLRDAGRMSFGPLLRHFYLRRAQRILPPYLLALTAIAIIVPQNWRALWPYYVFFLQNVPYALHQLDFGPLVPFWSLAVEQHFYLVWPFLVFFAPRRWLTPCLLIILLGTPLLRAVCTPLFSTSEPIYVLTPFRLDTMAAGALAALWLPRCDPKKALRWAQRMLPCALAVYAVLGKEPWFRRSANTPAFNSLAYTLNVVVLGCLFVWAVAAPGSSWLNRLLSTAPLRALGRISYTFYLFHLPILQKVLSHMRLLPGAAVAFLLTATVATLSWQLLEKPILALGGKSRKGASLRPNAI